MASLDPSKVQVLLEKARSRPLFIPVLLAVSTGLRLGEILGLTWEDINLEGRVLVVRRSASSANNRADTPVQFKEPKSGKARRVSLPEVTVRELDSHQESQRELQSLLRRELKGSDLVVSEPDGRPIRSHLLSKRFCTFMASTGLPRLRFHDLRHSHDTALLLAGIHPKVVSERLGHSSIQITLDTYTHVLPGMQDEAARRFNSILENERD